MKNLMSTRRDFIRNAGKAAVGAVALTAVPSVLKPAAAEGTAEIAWPLEYKQLDKQAVLERGYKAFYTHGGCCAGAVAAIVEELAEKYGYPYNQIPSKAFAYGAGGYGAQTLCGSLGGVGYVFGLFCEAADARALRDKVYSWYKDHPFPQYQPEIPCDITTVSESIQCSDSVGKFMAATGYAMGDPGRMARCAAVTGETAAKAVELLNIFFGFEEEPIVVAEPEPTVEGEEYIGVGHSAIGGDVKVKVTVNEGKIVKIDILEQNETPAIAENAFKQIPQAIIDAQSCDVDVVSGATRTSEALIEAVKDALSQVK